MITRIETLLEEVEKFAAQNKEQVEEHRIKWLSKKGEISVLFDEFKNVPNELKKEVGQKLNLLKNKAQEKIKKDASNLNVELIKTKDILKTLGEKKYTGQLLVGFALETNNEKENALNKLTSKNADLIVLNSLNDEGAGFGHDTNKITIFEKGGKEISYERKPKQQVAKDIVDRIVNMLHG